MSRFHSFDNQIYKTGNIVTNDTSYLGQVSLGYYKVVKIYTFKRRERLRELSAMLARSNYLLVN